MANAIENDNEITVSTTTKPAPASAKNGHDHARSERNFPIKLWDLLVSLEAEGLEHIVSWSPHGRCFVVRNQEEFVNTILPV